MFVFKLCALQKICSLTITAKKHSNFREIIFCQKSTKHDNFYTLNVIILNTLKLKKKHAISEIEKKNNHKKAKLKFKF